MPNLQLQQRKDRNSFENVSQTRVTTWRAHSKRTQLAKRTRKLKTEVLRALKTIHSLGAGNKEIPRRNQSFGVKKSEPKWEVDQGESQSVSNSS
jgi:hypothetical protein